MSEEIKIPRQPLDDTPAGEARLDMIVQGVTSYLSRKEGLDSCDATFVLNVILARIFALTHNQERAAFILSDFRAMQAETAKMALNYAVLLRGVPMPPQVERPEGESLDAGQDAE